MGEVVKLHEKNIEKFIKQLYEMAESGELKSLIVGGKLSNGESVTGQCQCSYDDRKVLISDMNTDLVIRPFIQANYVTPDH
jgi:hypothetical protein